MAIKSVDKTFATIGDTISYTITLNNPGNVTSQNIIFTDILPDGTTFISGTLTNDSGTQQSEIQRIQIGNINPNGTAVITLNVLVTNIPSINPISNSSSVHFHMWSTLANLPYHKRMYLIRFRQLLTVRY